MTYQLELKSIFNIPLPNGIVIVEQNSLKYPLSLLKEEIAFISNFSSNRLIEFTKGRNCMREALNILGFKNTSIPIGSKGEPILPNNVIGSITHTKDFCMAIAMLRNRDSILGIDAEYQRFSEHEALLNVFTEHEKNALFILKENTCNNAPWETIIFSAKESVYKAINAHKSLDAISIFDIEILIDPMLSTFSFNLLNNYKNMSSLFLDIIGYYRVNQGIIFTIAINLNDLL